MKALIIDPAVHSLGGHHFNAVQRLRDELAGLGVAAPCLGSAYADSRVVDELACTPTFTRLPGLSRSCLVRMAAGTS